MKTSFLVVGVLLIVEQKFKIDYYLIWDGTSKQMYTGIYK